MGGGGRVKLIGNRDQTTGVESVALKRLLGGLPDDGDSSSDRRSSTWATTKVATMKTTTTKGKHLGGGSKVCFE